MDESTAFVFICIVIIFVFLIQVALWRWIFRVNHIVDSLDKAETHLRHITIQNKTLIKQQDEIVDLLEITSEQNKTLIKQQDEIAGLLEVTSEIIDEASSTTNEQ